MLRIGDFSKLSRISIRMLRHYDEMGLLSPVMVDEMTNYRYYGECQLETANQIIVLKEMGFTLAAIKELMQSEDREQKLSELLADKMAETEVALSRIKHQKMLLNAAMEKLRKGEAVMKYNVVLKTIPEQYVASVRQTIAQYDNEGVLWQIMQEETKDQNLQMESSAYVAGVYHDKEYKENDVDVEVRMAVKGSYQDTEHVKFVTIPEVKVASVTFKGSYAHMPEVYMAIANWVQEQGLEFNGPMFNIYYVSPGMTDNEEDYVTEVCYPVA